MTLGLPLAIIRVLGGGAGTTQCELVMLWRRLAVDKHDRQSRIPRGTAYQRHETGRLESLPHIGNHAYLAASNIRVFCGGCRGTAFLHKKGGPRHSLLPSPFSFLLLQKRPSPILFLPFFPSSLHGAGRMIPISFPRIFTFAMSLPLKIRGVYSGFAA